MAVNIGGTDTANAGQASARAQALARGYSPEEVDAFIAHEGGARTSTSRILTAFAPRDASGQGTATPSNQSAEGLALNEGAGGGQSTPGGGGGAGFGSGGPVGGVPPSVQKAALTGLSAGDQTGIGIGAGAGGAGGVTNTFAQGGPGQLRQNLGNRIYPQESEALAQLRKAY